MSIFEKFFGKKTEKLEPAPEALVPQIAVDFAGDADLVHAMGDFGLSLGAAEQGNFVCSGYSIYEAWLRVWAGARGTCREELNRALGVEDELAVRESLSELVVALGLVTNADCEVSTANAIWVRPGLPINAQFEQDWGGATRELDFTDAERAADTVNGWVSECTRGLIPHVVDARVITPETAMMLANAIYLKAKWLTEFKSFGTSPRTFTTASDENIQVETMWNRSEYRCCETADFELLRKPYRGGGLEMVVVLPRRGRFEAVRSGLRYGAVAAAMSAAEVRDTVLQLPRFCIESAPTVDPIIKGRGARAVYSPDSADLSGISPHARNPGEELFVGCTSHRARIDVNEEGTEAAAATVVAVAAGAAPTPRPPPYDFHVDRPFLYFVVDASSRLPLFSGHVVDPR